MSRDRATTTSRNLATSSMSSSGSVYSSSRQEQAQADRETSDTGSEDGVREQSERERSEQEQSEREDSEREQRSQVVARRPNVPQRDDKEVYIDNEHLIHLVEERIPLWDSRDQQYKDTVVTRQLWNEVATAMMDGWDSASASSKRAFMNKIRTHWRSMKDRFNTDVRTEGQVQSGSAARRRRKYRYYRELAFLRPVLASRATWSSTLQPVPGAVLHRSTSDPSQPSDSQEASCRSATQTAGDQEAGPSSVPLSQVSVTGYAGTTRQQQRTSDRPVMPEFMHLSEAFQASLKALSARTESGFALMERGFNHMEHRFHSVDQRLDHLEADLNRPAHHYVSKIEQGMAGYAAKSVCSAVSGVIYNSSTADSLYHTSDFCCIPLHGHLHSQRSRTPLLHPKSECCWTLLRHHHYVKRCSCMEHHHLQSTTNLEPNHHRTCLGH
ncbi:vascular endothelial growth factor C isoform X1 [Dendrobates tinctorius]|uniref:vascular endothelial growth factor C isoform X1 n=1 Tax=Dendrobates tinctorius TaxID=92724 RepID=UPI003CCA1A42